ncbi:unnamed protein product [Porites evermanni]|uniref:Ribosomal protein S2 n=1 Tax=Porites evermanni TaxID=104178 RepID=A0ABN8NBX0_9CNID|nr:unnamed protein product [Porites evermanni]
MQDSLGRCGFHAVEFGFQILDTGSFLSGTCVLESNRLRDSGVLVLYSGLHQQKFPRFWNLDSLKKGDILVNTVNFFTPTVMDMSILLAISNSSVYNAKLLNRNMVFLIPTTLPARKVLLNSCLLFFRKNYERSENRSWCYCSIECGFYKKKTKSF